METLPDAVTGVIADFLLPRDLARLGAVSRAWASVTRPKLAVWWQGVEDYAAEVLDAVRIIAKHKTATVAALLDLLTEDQPEAVGFLHGDDDVGQENHDDNTQDPHHERATLSERATGWVRALLETVTTAASNNVFTDPALQSVNVHTSSNAQDDTWTAWLHYDIFTPHVHLCVTTCPTWSTVVVFNKQDGVQLFEIEMTGTAYVSMTVPGEDDRIVAAGLRVHPWCVGVVGELVAAWAPVDVRLTAPLTDDAVQFDRRRVFT